MSNTERPPGCKCREYVGDALKVEADCPVHGQVALAKSPLQPNERDARRVRVIDFDTRILLRMLGIPDETILVDVRPHPQRAGLVSLLVAHPCFAPVERGEIVPTISPTYHDVPGKRPELLEWNDPKPTGGN